jgi:hypothetical protein
MERTAESLSHWATTRKKRKGDAQNPSHVTMPQDRVLSRCLWEYDAERLWPTAYESNEEVR